ncbi:phenylalanyl-tRNA synthase subunit beta [Aneurinibacillus migulanus]|uniref:phenylalanine--tRNA ligase subunit beta n=1 Tax=Aneurinibacillus migulanus TaxID=47500 RepID=UPI0005B880D9|nr:phenylalanine--tRNA ligase subunit beta [Aneurinibacillus migulanus]KIV59932.1 phenylalanyl-tRNA synthase subunit beta [Aneurinibacillus migulanus]KPD07132.1 phenylalanyl-tRNA synthase subunit beta [Aneurinibacillus migulanus]CEH27634.1 Phenylalanine--tRNA ligase beta subunit (EC 6.1.1 .20) (Phenylalanyl-tRNA synthetase beta subunit) [Aneurinibacillus migulanus]
MKVSYNWLAQYVDVSGITPEELAEKLTRSGVEVDAVEHLNKGVTDVVVGYVTEKEKHPDADKLNVCQVDVGGEELLQIVCGAKNVEAGQKVPVAVVGAKLPGDFKIKKAKLRGVASNGMICSAKELGINDKLMPKEIQEGILVLPEDLEVGQPIQPILGLDDVVLELGLTPNRSDCLSMMGVAYEVAAILDRDVKLPEGNVPENGPSIEGKVEVNIEAPEHCHRYMARMISGIKLAPSPLWMQNRLMAAGVRPINNVVDITNYVMLETGQPLHAFDYAKVDNGHIVVRLAKSGETIVTLDDAERTLDEEMLLITDGTKAIGVAGVMGGANSEVTGATDTILLESAHFAGSSIRKTARKLGLRSEASLRFEKEVNPQAVEQALDRAAALIAELANGHVSQGKADQALSIPKEKQVDLHLSRLNGLLGTDLQLKDATTILERLKFTYVTEGETLKVTVPTRRQDITREVDVIEEVARLYGYDHIPTTMPYGDNTQGMLTREQMLRRTIRQVLNGAGLDEVSAYSFTHPDIAHDFATVYRETKPIPLAMPMSEERSVLRINLLPHLLETAAYNNNRKERDLALFEIGKVFLSDEETLSKLPEEHLTLGGLLTGNWVGPHWQQKAEPVDFYLVKGILDVLLNRLGITGIEYRPAKDIKGMHPGRTAQVILQGKGAGYVGQVHPATQQKYDVDETYVFQLDADLLIELATMHQGMIPLPKYPAISRDIAVVVDRGISAGDLQKVIETSAGEWLESVRIFDVYVDDRLGENKKSVALSCTYRDPERTLTDEEVQAAHSKVVETLAAECGAELRG